MNDVKTYLNQILSGNYKDASSTIKKIINGKVSKKFKNALNESEYDYRKHEYPDASAYESGLKQVPIIKVKKGEYFQLKPHGPMWVRGDYDRLSRKISVSKAEDFNHEGFIKSNRLVYIGATY